MIVAARVGNPDNLKKLVDAYVWTSETLKPCSIAAAETNDAVLEVMMNARDWSYPIQREIEEAKRNRPISRLNQFCTNCGARSEACDNFCCECGQRM